MTEMNGGAKKVDTNDDIIGLYIKASADASEFSGPIEKDERAARAMWFCKTDDFTEISNCLKAIHKHAGYDATFDAAKFISRFESDAEARLDMAVKLASMAKDSPGMFQKIAASLKELRPVEHEMARAFMQYTDRFALFILLQHNRYQYLSAGDDLELVGHIEKLMRLRYVDRRMSEWTREILNKVGSNLKSNIFNRAEIALKTAKELHRM